METLKTKVCAKCGHTLSVDKFYHNSHNADGYSDICRPCACKRKPSSGGGKSRPRTLHASRADRRASGKRLQGQIGNHARSKSLTTK